jgi:hypothetical protein
MFNVDCERTVGYRDSMETKLCIGSCATKIHARVSALLQARTFVGVNNERSEQPQFMDLRSQRASKNGRDASQHHL